jgi:glycosyltransferase involved in cell wall biosynthesis
LACATIIDLKAEVAHISLNARGGAERLSVSAIKSLSEMGIEIELRTFERPNPHLMNEAYGDSLENKISNILTPNWLSTLMHPERKSDVDIHINTHGDMLPYFLQDFSKYNSIVYCHYPIAGALIDSEDKDYLDLFFNFSSSSIPHDKRDYFLERAKVAYTKMLLNSRVLTNSEFSRKAIFKMYGIDSTVLYPPVDTEFFQKSAFSSQHPRSDDILVISRFHRSKKIENAIRLAKLLRRRAVGRRITIVGNISPDGFEYYEYLRKLTKDYGLQDFVKFEPSATFSRLIELVRSSKVYLHPLPGEPFGISTVESMSAGLIPVVPNIGGHTEFVPSRFQFRTYEEGVDAVAEALNAPASEHLWMSHRASAFSVHNFVSKFKLVVSDMIDSRKPQLSTNPLVPAQKTLSDAAA